ncbi:MAG TPA: CPBP family intramembrane glutamic endopeptidase, partial [Ferruginibacter sp.]|nr:CPBP family intramembrane glutamic endopeptidase [Ferruginibacter sp.]
MTYLWHLLFEACIDVYCGANLQQSGLAMQYKSVKGISGWGQLGILAAFTGLGFILAGVVQLIIGLQLIKSGVGSDQMADEMMKALMKPENVAYARAAQIVGTFFLLFVPAVLYLLVTHGRNPFWLGFNKHISYQQVIIGFFIIVAANIMAQPLADLTQSIISHAPNLDAMARRMETTYNDQVKAMGHLKNIPELIMAIVVIAFFPAMFEEIFFRGAVQNLLVRWWRSPMLAIIVTSLLFSIIHLSIYLFLSRA